MEFNANGQKIFIEQEWITGRTCLFNVHNTSDYFQGMIGLSTIRKEFIKKLESQGFVVTTDKNDNDPDMVYLIMNNTAIIPEGEDIGAYKKAFDQRMFDAAGPSINYPYSVSIEEYFEHPFFPAVFKNESTNAGKDKLLVETPEQLEIFKKFYETYKNKPNYKEQFGCSIFQQLIETPTENKTYMRVLMSASGDVLGASLKYSRPSMQERPLQGTFEKHLLDPKSPYYLHSSQMFNYYSGGGNINLGDTRLCYSDKQILIEHGIDPENPEVPAAVMEVASNIARNANRELGIMCGIDFIMDKKDGKWYYLEVQAFPAIEEWAVPRRIRLKEVRNMKDYIKMNAQDLEARYEALMLYMNKKLTKDTTTSFTYIKKKPE